MDLRIRRTAVGVVLLCSVFMGSALADDDNHPDFINWELLERWTFSQDYKPYENSTLVEWLQYWLGVEPRDGIYGPQTNASHMSKGLALGIAVQPIEMPSRTFPANVERWRGEVVLAIERYGGPASDITRFLSVMRCESQGLPDATNSSSGAAGLMQHLPQFWDWRARMAGFEGASPYDPIANINVSSWLLYEHVAGGWAHWNFGCLG